MNNHGSGWVDGLKAEIDAMDYQTQLEHYRRDEPGTGYFSKEAAGAGIEHYFVKSLSAKRKELSREEQDRISKLVGWNG